MKLPPKWRKRSPPGARRARQERAPAPGPSESVIQRAVVRHLTIYARPGVVFFHPANGGARSKVEAARFRGEGVVAGVPDLVIVAGGRPYFLELKAARGRLSAAQRSMHDRLSAAGASVVTAYTIDDAISWLKQMDFLK